MQLDVALKGMVPSDSEVKYDRNGSPIVLYRRAILGGDILLMQVQA